MILVTVECFPICTFQSQSRWHISDDTSVVLVVIIIIIIIIIVSHKVINFIEKTMKTWRVELTAGGKSLAETKIQRGIFQGDALSPLLFIIAMMSLNHILRKCTAKYKLSWSQEKINHLMHMDDIKLFEKNEKNLETLIYTVRIYSQDIRMEFGIEKCAMLVMKSGKLKECEKKDKYLDLAWELKKLWNMKVMIVPIVIGAFGTITKGLLKGQEDLEVGGRVETIQMTALLKTVRILRRVLGTRGDLLALKLQWKTISWCWCEKI